MVNTFIPYRLSPKESYQRGAKVLDTKRLMKQILEAYQILKILSHLHIASKYVETTNTYRPMVGVDMARYLENVEWTKEVRRGYLSLGYTLFRKKGHEFKKVTKLPIRMVSTYIRIPHSTGMVLLIPKSSKCTQEDYVTDDPEVVKMMKRYPKRRCIYVEDKGVCEIDDDLLTLGFSQHAIIKMWVGYESSLKNYISAHLKEYNRRGYTMRVPYQDVEVPKTQLKPWWVTKIDHVALSHRSSLLRKEIVNEEKEWYTLLQDFTSVPSEWLESGYVWTGSMTGGVDTLNTILSETIPTPQKEYTQPIQPYRRATKEKISMLLRKYYDSECDVTWGGRSIGA